MAGLAAPASSEERTSPYLELLGVAKNFGGVQALDDVSLGVERGSVHALVGENGAGKSTLGRIVAGVLTPDAGRMTIAGDEVSFRSPRDALELKVAAIAQEPSIVPRLSVAENVFLGREPRGGGFVRSRKLVRSYEELASVSGFDLPGGMPAGRLRTAEQQKVEILRALSRDAQLIVMDEPTAALAAHEALQLHEIVRSLAKAGKTILLISHFLREVLALADAVTVLRDGRLVRTSPTAEETEASLIEAMLGRSLTATFPAKQPPGADAARLLSVEHVSAPGVHDVSFELRQGEILGLAGLVGAGRTELALALFGAAKVESGTVVSSSGERFGRTPRRSLGAGLALIPESRKDAGLIFGRSVTENTTLSRLRSFSAVGIVRRARERKAARQVLERFDVRGAGFSSPVRALSGGNQQKVLLARTVLCGPQVLIADEPTRGVDIGAKRAIYDFLAELAAGGLGVIVISSELEELLGLAHRVLVMRGGRVVGEFQGETMTESALLAAAFADESSTETRA